MAELKRGKGHLGKLRIHLLFHHLSLRREPPFTGVCGPSGPEITIKSQSRSFGGRPKSPRKYPRKSEKGPKKSESGTFWSFFDFLGYFRELSGGPPRRPFLRLFCDFGPEGPEAPVNGGLGRKPGLGRKSFRKPQPLAFSQKHCWADGRRTAVQTGGVCTVSGVLLGFPLFKA